MFVALMSGRAWESQRVWRAQCLVWRRAKAPVRSRGDRDVITALFDTSHTGID